MDNVIKLQRETDNYKITKYKKEITIDFTYYDKYQNLKTEVKKTNLIFWNHFYINNQYYFFPLFNIDLNESYNLQSDNLTSNFKLYKLLNDGADWKLIDTKQKCHTIISNMLSKNLFFKIRKYETCDREKILYKNRLYTLYYLFDLLEENGNFMITLYGYCDQTIEILYLLTYMFDYIYIFKNSEVYCSNFNSVISKEEIKKLINNKFSIQPKHNLNKLVKYFEKSIKYEYKSLKLQYDYYDDKYTILILEDLIIMYYYLNPYQKNDIYRYIEYYFMKIYYDDNLFLYENKIYKYIVNVINKFNCKNCLELGMGFGLYSFFILANKKTSLTSIDINQNKFYNIGIKLLKKFKFDTRHTLIKSNTNLNNNYDFIFIDFFYNQDINLDYYKKLLSKNGVMLLYKNNRIKLIHN